VRRVGYHWHLRRLMAERDMFATTDLGPLLADRGVVLSREQVYRLVTGTPQRLSLTTLAALCDILSCAPGDLVEPYRPSAATTSRTARPDRRPVDGSSQERSSSGSSPRLPRPLRARIVPDTP
jgi:DNA-binding Xre family transcriptional regulator